MAVDGGARLNVDPVTNAMTVPNDRRDSDGLRYSVVSSAAVPTPDQLRDAPQADPEIVGRVHTSLMGVPAEIQAQAQELTAGLPTEYDKVIAIQDHLRSLTHVVDPEDTPSGTDPAVRLLETREGSGGDFASAMALLARTLGVPSRVAIGFTSGERVDDPGDDTTSNLVTFKVTNHDAHAWTEIYFQGIGWVGFEPTPGQSMPLAERYTGTTQGQEVETSPEDCVAHGGTTIEVPNVVGLALSDAVLQARRAGLNVIGSGVPPDDPTGDDAVVRAQEPPAGSSIPEGACIGFRTSQRN
jgi:transglutaminase-like putative cysteine protease